MLTSFEVNECSNTSVSVTCTFIFLFLYVHIYNSQACIGAHISAFIYGCTHRCTYKCIHTKYRQTYTDASIEPYIHSKEQNLEIWEPMKDTLLWPVSNLG